MRIPVYVVTGFLDSGKTSLLKHLLNQREMRETQLLLIQFESGEEEFSSRDQNCDVLGFSKEDLEQCPKQISQQIGIYLNEHEADEVWIEWNGVTSFSELQALFSDTNLHRACKIKKVIHMADAETLDVMLGRTGGAMPEQISNCDLAVVRNMESNDAAKHVRRLMRSINPDVDIYEATQTSKILRDIYSTYANPISILCIGIVWFMAVYYIIATPSFDLSQTPLNILVNVFLGIILQAVPFLLVGVLISSAIQIFLSSDVIERKFPKKLGLGMLVAVFLGFCMPVCDCASVPIFRSLVKKGVPIPAAVTFLTATPVINPVVILSTYYAFNGSLRVVAVRVGLGIISSFLIGLLFAIVPSRGKILSDSFDGIMCSCGCYDGAPSVTGVKGKFGLFIRHSQAEFFNVGKYLMLGAFISAFFQTIGTRSLSVQNGAGFALSLLVMIIMAFLLSLCSTSDAVVARSFSSNFSTGAVMGFLVFGPMMDIKNLFMLSGGFSKGFVGKLLLFTFIVCYFVVFTLARPLLGV